MPSDVKWRKREKQNDHHEKISFFHIAEFSNGFCFIFEKKSSSYPMLFVHVGKSSSETLRSSRSQMFFKIGVLKSFSIFAKKHLCSIFFFLIKLRAWRPAFLLKKCFPVNIAKFLRTAFLWNTFCSLYFHVTIEFFECLWVQNWRVLYSCTIAVFLHNSSVRIKTP